MFDRIKNLNPFKGQKGQDKWVIFEILPFRFGGYFIDLAAADGVTHSNTYVLEKVFRWKGVCIEPNPYFIEKIRACRHCQIEETVISDTIEEIEFRIDNGQLGGIIAEDTDNNPNVREEQLKTAEIIRLRTETLNEVLDRINAPRIIDYFSLDVEGSEERVIKAIDFDRYQFQCLTIERPTPVVNQILFENSYIFVKNHRYDSFYIHPDILKKHKIKTETFEQVPAKDW